ncbi:MAG TPA: ComEC/Rec2 family competence protein [Acidimicrobiia bacterium]|nr:ComEC/Rec2 family competence protein [Acidimicrobiia bacterium]
MTPLGVAGTGSVAAAPSERPPPVGPLRADLGAVLAAAAVLLGARAGEHPAWAAADIPPCALVATPPLLLFFWTWHIGRRRITRPEKTERWCRVAGLACLAALGAVSMARAVAGLDGVSARLAAGEVEGAVAVRLAADPQGRWTGVRVPARLEAVGARGARGTVLVVARRAAAGRLRLLEAGESAVLTGRFRELGAAERPWRWRHAGAVFEAEDLVGAGSAAPGLVRVANRLRGRVLAGVEGLGETDRALVAGFLVGDDRDLPPQVAAEFRASGLSHLLVVSGANVTLALAVMAPVLRRFRLVGRLMGGAAVLVVFCAMTRFEPSVLRAGVMSGLALLAAFLGRPANGLRLLTLAVTGLVLLDPFLVHSLGFGLSCGASAGILLLAGRLARRFPGPRFLREALAVTAAAQVGVAPIALPAFGYLPLAAFPANLAAAPAAAALSVWGLGSGLAGGLLGGAGGGPASLLHVPTAVLAGWIRAVAHVAAGVPVTIGPRAAAFVAVLGVIWWHRSGGADAVPAGGSRFPEGVGLEAQPVVEGQQAGPGQQERGGGDGVEQVEFEPAPARLAEHPDVPLDPGHDQQELGGGQGAPQPREQPEGEADPADQLDDDRGPGEELGEREAVPVDGDDELRDAAVELLPPVVRQHRAHHDPNGEQGGPGGKGPAGER